MAINKEFLAKIVIEPLDSKHKRAAFSCGETRIDNYIRHSAANHAKNDFVKVYVASKTDSDIVIGYYVLGPHAIDATSLPPEFIKKLPKWPLISAIYLSMIAVDNSCQGKGLGSFLIADAFERCIQAADIIGGYFIVLDAINEKAARLYRRCGFIELSSPPLRMIVSAKKVRGMIAAAK
ncbi:GNAT family N-acetyltransferase [Desulfolutivibrio sp.]|uniref:GNAT family N-acetyltransferase n=1 Tax=Desulfolutivibrio sp. TaxID=2773296 RepID=UPI002F96AEF2